MEQGSEGRAFGPYWQLSVGIAVFALLYIISRSNYLLFHGIAEIFSSLVAFTIFVLAWHTRRYTENDYLLFLGIAYFFVGVLDLIHMLAYPGMGVFDGYGTNLATQLWIAARYLEAVSLLLAPIFLSRRLRVRVALAAFAALWSLTIAGIFFLDIFPVCFVEGTGLTPFKVISEYIISLFLVAAVIVLFRKRRQFCPRVFRLVVASILLTVASELCFTLYQDPYAFPNLLGHFLKIVSFYLIYRAIVETGLEEPYELLFRRLNEKERRERAILDATADSLLLLDTDLRILAINAVAAHNLGGSAEGLVGADLAGLAPAPLYGRMKSMVDEVISGNASVRSEERLGGRWYENTCYPVLDGDGEVGMLAVYSRDISQRKKIEEELRESEEKFRSVVEQSSDGIVLVDSNGRIIEWNSAQENIMGLMKKEALGQYLWDVQFRLASPEQKTPAAYGRLKAHVLDSLGKGYAYWLGETSEREMQTPGGERRIVQSVTFPIRSSEGIMGGSITRDITRRVRMEEKLSYELEVNRAQAELSASMLAQASIEDVSCIVLDNAKLLTGSPFGYVGYIEAGTGYLISPTLTRDIWEECEIEDKSVVFKEFKGLWGWVLDNREPLLSNEPGRDPRSAGVPDGHIAIERYISVPALLGGALVGQIALANSERDYDERDIALLNRLADLYAVAVLRMWSEEELAEYRLHLEELVKERTVELEEANRQLQEEIAERMRNQEELKATAEQLRALSARVESVREEERRHVAREVHDTLGQTLTGLKINLSLLAKKLTGDKEAEERVAYMSGMVDTTIQSVREIATQLRPGVLDDLGLEAALDWQLKRFGKMTGLECVFVSEAEEEAMDKGVATSLFRITQEALTNIARHAGAGRVDVRLSQGRREVVLEIRDDGRGISSEDLGSMDSLGILGMRERTKIYGGELEIRGEDGAGTTLVVRIPVGRQGLGGGAGREEDGG